MQSHIIFVPLFPWFGLSLNSDNLPYIMKWIRNNFSLTTLLTPTQQKESLQKSDSLFSHFSKLIDSSIHWDITDYFKYFIINSKEREKIKKVYMNHYALDLLVKSDVPTTVIKEALGKMFSNSIRSPRKSYPIIDILSLRVHFIERKEKFDVSTFKELCDRVYYKPASGNGFNFVGSSWGLFYVPDSLFVTIERDGMYSFDLYEFYQLITAIYSFAAVYSLIFSYKSTAAILAIEKSYAGLIFNEFEHKHCILQRKLLGLDKQYFDFVDSIISQARETQFVADPKNKKLLYDIYGDPTFFDEIIEFFRHILKTGVKDKERDEDVDSILTILVQEKCEIDNYVVEDLETQINQAIGILMSKLQEYIEEFNRVGDLWYTIHVNKLNTNRTILALFSAFLGVIFTLIKFLGE